MSHTSLEIIYHISINLSLSFPLGVMTNGMQVWDMSKQESKDRLELLLHVIWESEYHIHSSRICKISGRNRIQIMS